MAEICKQCHSQIHATWTNKELARTYNTVEIIRKASEFQPYLRWVRSKPADAVFRTKQSCRKRRR